MKKIVLDTNILIAISQFKIDPFAALEEQMYDKYTIFVLDKVIAELEKLINKGRLSEKKAAKLALELIKHKKLEIIITPKNDLTADDELLKLKGYTILTQDKELKKQLKEKGTEVLTMRQKKRIIKA
ncbi:MAG: PIN domain-containing protein [archaeon]